MVCRPGPRPAGRRDATGGSLVPTGGARMSGVTHLVQSGPLILAAPIAAAAGAITFLSPCCLPLVPGYLSYVTGMSGTDAQRAEAAAAERVAVAPDGTAVTSDGPGDGAGAAPGPASMSPGAASGTPAAAGHSTR